MKPLHHLTAITGGIGAGKSVVSHALRVMGYEVFDCDYEAKLIMDSDEEIKRRLSVEISPNAVLPNGSINRQHISSIVFSNPTKLTALNAIVHEAVRCRISEWQTESHKADRLFVETAILYQSGLNTMVDDVWEIIAPDEIRILRVMGRNHCNRQTVIDRINSQTFVPKQIHPSTHSIVNDDFTPLLPQLLNLLK